MIHDTTGWPPVRDALGIIRTVDPDLYRQMDGAEWLISLVAQTGNIDVLRHAAMGSQAMTAHVPDVHATALSSENIIREAEYAGVSIGPLLASVLVHEWAHTPSGGFANGEWEPTRRQIAFAERLGNPRLVRHLHALVEQIRPDGIGWNGNPLTWAKPGPPLRSCVMEVHAAQRTATMVQACAHNTNTVIDDLRMLRPILAHRRPADLPILDATVAELRRSEARLLEWFGETVAAETDPDAHVGGERSLTEQAHRDAVLARRFETR